MGQNKRKIMECSKLKRNMGIMVNFTQTGRKKVDLQIALIYKATKKLINFLSTISIHILLVGLLTLVKFSLPLQLELSGTACPR